MRIAAELRDHEAAGSLAEELPYWGWLEDGRTCLTRTGELIAAGRLEPAVVDGRSPEQIDRVLGRWQRLLSGLDSDTRLYFYLLRRPASPEAADDEGSGIVAVSQRKRGAFLSGRVQRLEAYLVWSHDPRLRAVADGPTSGRASRLRQWWKRRRGGAPTYLRSEIEAAAARFRATVDAGRALVEEHTPIEMLEPAEASRLLSELINRPGTVWDGATGSGMNWRLALSELEAERGHLRLDGEPVILYSLLSPPGQAREPAPGALLPGRGDDGLARVAALGDGGGEAPDPGRAAALLRAPLLDDGARAGDGGHGRRDGRLGRGDRVGSAGRGAGRAGSGRGELRRGHADRGAPRRAGKHRAAGRRPASSLRRARREGDPGGLRPAAGLVLAAPGPAPWAAGAEGVRVGRRGGVSGAALRAARGTPRSRHLGRESLAVLETPWRTAYHYDLFAGDVGHTLMLGATGSGKSFTLNFLLVEALRYDPRVLILDLGGSYRWLTRFLGGRYLELSPGEAEPTLRLQPFALPAGTRTFQFLTGWVLRLLKLGGWEASGADTSEIRSRIEDLYAFEPERRTLSVLASSLPSATWPAWSRWIEGGAWGGYFDNPAGGAPDLEFADWQVIDLAGAVEHPDLCDAALSYLLERMRLEVEDPSEAARLKLMVVDEAWRYLQDPAVLSYLAEAAKTWRKKNAALIMATQSAVDVTATPGAAALLESIPTKLFLANPELPDAVGALFRLSESELAQVRGLIPKRELYLRRPDGAAVLRLEVDPESYWLYTSSALDAEERARAVERHGLARALEVLASRDDPTPTPNARS